MPLRAMLLWVGLATAGAGPREAPDDPKPPPADPAAAAEARAEYETRRAGLPGTADAHWDLALWCERNGLATEAKRHLEDVVRLDPDRDAAWRRLGYKKRDGRWLSPQDQEELQARREIDRRWEARVAEWHGQVHDARTRADALAKLGALTEPDAVPAVWRHFGTGNSVHQEQAVRILGQIRSRESSRALAVLAVFGRDEAVRRQAAEVLRWRDPVEFIGPIVGLLRDPLKFEIQPVGGPGSPGALFIEGERFNVRRLYAAPPPPEYRFGSDDIIVPDEFGLPRLRRFDGSRYMVAEARAIESNMREAVVAARAAQDRLAEDVAMVRALNEAIGQSNGQITTILTNITGQDQGADGKSWRDWLARQKGFTEVTAQRPKPTFNELVPMSYVPTFVKQRPG